MKVSSIQTNTLAFRAQKKKDDSQVEEVAAVGGGAVGGKAAYELSKINKVATKAGTNTKKITSVITDMPKEAKNYTASIERFLKALHLDRLFKLKGGIVGKALGITGGALSLGAATEGIVETAGTFSQLATQNKNA